MKSQHVDLLEKVLARQKPALQIRVSTAWWSHLTFSSLTVQRKGLWCEEAEDPEIKLQYTYPATIHSSTHSFPSLGPGADATENMLFLQSVIREIDT